MKAEFLVYDRELALTQVGGNPTTADEFLKMMLGDLPNQRVAMVRALDAGRTDQLKAIVHRIRGAACCCGTPGVAESSSALEFAIKLDAENDIPALVESLLDEIEQLISCYGTSGKLSCS